MRIPAFAVLAFVLILSLQVTVASAEGGEPFCVFYFSSVGCSHCANVDPVLFGEWLDAYPDLVVIDYELSGHTENAGVFDSFVDGYGIEWGVPTLVVTENLALQGDRPILAGGPGAFANRTEGAFLLSDLSLTDLGGHPRVWYGEKVLIREGAGGDEELLKAALLADDINTVLCGQAFDIVDPVPVQHSGETMTFAHAVRLEGWVVQWNGEDLTVEPCGSTSGNPDGTCGVIPICLTVPKIVSLAIVDAVNPCAMAVLSLILIAILTTDPTNKRRALYAGLAFSLAIFILYIVYGVIIITFFQLIQALTSARLVIYKLFGLAAIALGLLQLKDYVGVGPKGLLTTMPKPLRSPVSRLTASVTSMPGAFVIGAFVTVFLLPCTIGPYIIAGGLLSVYQLGEVAPYLLLYNAIFILPMLAITGLIYIGYARVEEVSGWKQQNIRYLHGVAGTIMLLLGIGMVAGLI